MRNINHYLASANTGVGFVDKFEYILDSNKYGFTYILKGGPGTGKSTILKRIGAYFSNIGLDVEYFHCSSDYESMDGVKIPKYNVSVIDGTAPHMKDPSLPHIDAKIVDLTDCINSKVNRNMKTILKLKNKKSMCFNLAYKYLKVLKEIKELSLEIYKNSFKNDNYNKVYDNIINKLNLANSQNEFYSRTLFLDYIGKEKIENIENFNNYSNKIIIDLDMYSNFKMIEEIKNYLKTLNQSYIEFLDIITTKSKSIYITSIDTYITIKNQISTNSNIVFNEKLCSRLIAKVCRLLSKAKSNHLKIEKYYIPNVDFTSVDKLTLNLLDEIQK